MLYPTCLAPMLLLKGGKQQHSQGCGEGTAGVCSSSASKEQGDSSEVIQGIQQQNSDRK